MIVAGIILSRQTTEILRNVLFIICSKPPHFCVTVVTVCYPFLDMDADSWLNENFLISPLAVCCLFVSFLSDLILADCEMTHNPPVLLPCFSARERMNWKASDPWQILLHSAVSHWLIERAHFWRNHRLMIVPACRGCLHHSLCFYPLHLCSS